MALTLLRHAALAPYSTFRTGGPPDWLLLARTSDEVRAGVETARVEGLPLTILGGGSNVLIADAGVRGLVVRCHGGGASAPAAGIVRGDAGLTINGLVRWTIGHGHAGLEAWAGTPGTVGGAVHGNAHFQGRSIGELIDTVEIVDRAGIVTRLPSAAMEFAYDRSRLQRSGEVALSVDFRASSGEPARLREVARESLAFRKRTQPLDVPSAGCIFQNPSADTPLPPGVPCSAGALVDHAGLKGVRLGGARVSTTHANFIVNDGGATSRDIRALIDRCREAVRVRFGVELREEIVYLGFEDR